MADPVLILDPPNIVSQQDTQGRIMSSNALYYPYIQVPESPWFTRVLLYWDRVGAIVPNDYIEDPDRRAIYGQSRTGEPRRTGHSWNAPMARIKFRQCIPRIY